jgi:hypothetical protein
VIYGKTFLDLQVQFAHKVAALSGLPLDRALLDYTNLYIRLGLGREFDPAHPTWRAYAVGLQDAGDIREWTYRFYLRRPDAMAATGIVATVGCFSYSQVGGDRIRLHFENADTDGQSSLGIDHLGHRLGDLAALFAHVKRTLGEPLQVVGASWLYNLAAYRRLFPDSYLATARVIGQRFRHMPLWGQFLDRHGEVKEKMAHPFLQRLDGQSSLDGVGECFPFQVLSVQAPASAFYRHYRI